MGITSEEINSIVWGSKTTGTV